MKTLKNFLQKTGWKKIVEIVLASVLTLAPVAVTYAQIQVPCFAGMNCTTRVTNAADLIAFIIRIALLLVGGIAILFLIIGGFRYIASNGNQEQAKKGKATIVNALIGLVVVILAWVLVTAVISVTTNIPSTGSTTP